MANIDSSVTDRLAISIIEKAERSGALKLLGQFGNLLTQMIDLLQCKNFE